MESTESRINDLLSIENKTYSNFIKPYILSYQDINYHTWTLGHINSVKNTEDTQKVQTESLPIISDWFTKIGQREDIFQSFVEVSNTELLYVVFPSKNK